MCRKMEDDITYKHKIFYSDIYYNQNENLSDHIDQSLLLREIFKGNF